MSPSKAPPDLSAQVLAGDRRALARAATLIERQHSGARDLMQALFPFTGRAMTIGITGPPGAGKSTLVNALTATLRATGQSVAIMAVDPSSPYSGGAILGDRVRMLSHYADPDVFIRSTATRGTAGGLATSTLELALLFDAAGFDMVLIETVGVGQNEIEIADLADITVVVLAPGFGDDVQALKAGMMEVADIFAINKADLPGASQFQQEIRAMQELGKSPDGRKPAPVQLVVAAESRGIDDLLALIRAQFGQGARSDSRGKVWSARLRNMLRDSLLTSVPLEEYAKHADLVYRKKEDPYMAVAALKRIVVS